MVSRCVHRLKLTKLHMLNSCGRLCVSYISIKLFNKWEESSDLLAWSPGLKMSRSKRLSRQRLRFCVRERLSLLSPYGLPWVCLRHPSPVSVCSITHSPLMVLSTCWKKNPSTVPCCTDTCKLLLAELFWKLSWGYLPSPNRWEEASQKERHGSWTMCISKPLLPLPQLFPLTSNPRPLAAMSPGSQVFHLRPSKFTLHPFHTDFATLTHQWSGPSYTHTHHYDCVCA